MGEVRTSFRRTMSRMSRYSRTFSNSSTGRLDRAYEDIQVGEDKKVREIKCGTLVLHGSDLQSTGGIRWRTGHK